MRDPVQVTFRNMSADEALSEAVRSRAHWLETFDPDVAGCRVALEFPHRHKTPRRPFSIQIRLSLPGEDVTVRHEAVLHHSVAALYDADRARGNHQDAITAINDAFDIARRRLAAALGPHGMRELSGSKASDPAAPRCRSRRDCARRR